LLANKNPRKENRLGSEPKKLMNKLKAISKLVDGHKLRRKVWRLKTAFIFMEEDGKTYLAQRVNDPYPKPICLNKYPEDDWEILKEWRIGLY
jgi:hypothetical protein